MTKVMLAVFTALTLGAGYLTVKDVGVLDTAAKQVRKGAVHGGGPLPAMGGRDGPIACVRRR